MAGSVKSVDYSIAFAPPYSGTGLFRAATKMGGLTAVCRRRKRLHPRRRWQGRLVCAAKSRAPGSGAATHLIAVPLGKGCGENPLARRDTRRPAG